MQSSRHRGARLPGPSQVRTWRGQLQRSPWHDDGYCRTPRTPSGGERTNELGTSIACWCADARRRNPRAGRRPCARIGGRADRGHRNDRGRPKIEVPTSPDDGLATCSSRTPVARRPGCADDDGDDHRPLLESLRPSGGQWGSVRTEAWPAAFGTRLTSAIAATNPGTAFPPNRR